MGTQKCRLCRELWNQLTSEWYSRRNCKELQIILPHWKLAVSKDFIALEYNRSSILRLNLQLGSLSAQCITFLNQKKIFKKIKLVIHLLFNLVGCHKNPGNIEYFIWKSQNGIICLNNWFMAHVSFLNLEKII